MCIELQHRRPCPQRCLAAHDLVNSPGGFSAWSEKRRKNVNKKNFVHRQFTTRHKESVTRPRKRIIKLPYIPDDVKKRQRNRANMPLQVKYPKTCRNKKQSAAFLTPPDSSLSSSSGSLSSGNSERKHNPKRKTLHFKGHSTLIASIPGRKKLKTKKSLPASGSDSDNVLLRNNNKPTELDRNSLFSLCKSLPLCYCLLSISGSESVSVCWPRECRWYFPAVQSRLDMPAYESFLKR